MSNSSGLGARWNWRYEEQKQVGTDYSDAAEVERYDMAMRSVRNVGKEIQNILSLLDLKPGQIVLEIGTGTGEFAIAASRHCSKVIAIDVSEAMLNYARQKARDRGAENIDFKLAGFLSYEHSGPELDAVVTQLALHHLPDFWKQVALLRVHDMLKSGGRLYLMDAVFSFDCRNYEEFFDGYLADMEEASSKEETSSKEEASSRVDMVKDAACHIKEENSTSSWIMEGLLEHAGFKIDAARYVNGFIATYLCTRDKQPPKATGSR